MTPLPKQGEFSIMQSELNDLQNRYDDLLLSSTRALTDAEDAELCWIETRIREILFPIPRRADFTDQEWAAFWPAEEAARNAYDDAKYAEVM